MNNFLGDVLSRLNQNRAFENHYTEMHSIIDKVVTHTKSFEGLLISVSQRKHSIGVCVFVIRFLLLGPLSSDHRSVAKRVRQAGSVQEYYGCL